MATVTDPLQGSQRRNAKEPREADSVSFQEFLNRLQEAPLQEEQTDPVRFDGFLSELKAAPKRDQEDES